ncbi:Lysozyme-like domain protein [Akanthomyces lecanii RCEF 1005]|uniref:Lysozyme-like domain protein n=1 Tax=Akanthomyces lecanii RCEF 1005 TaxID=1081108 RepID=A0A168JNC6_CORDF|nr:Lysozyme-like domain protein [Akanthomyces lecanii RCEF 1005]
MKTSTSVALLSLFNAIAAYPTLKSIFVRDCQPGHLVCQGNGQFGICNIDSTAIFMNVAEGTKCVCSGSDCTIAALEAGNAPAQSSQDSPAPAPSSQSPAPSPSSQAAPPPPSQPAPESTQSASTASSQPTSQQPAPQPTAPSTSAATAPAPTASSSAGGVFKEIPTATLPVPETSSAASPSQSSAPSSGSSPGGINIGGGKAYLKTFTGDGAASAGWPSQSQWGSFESMWQANVNNVMSKSCTGFGQANNSPSESADIKSAIENVAQSSGVDARFILAIVMQESNGCVRAPTTNYGVINPGLMQSHDGSSSCFNVNPCPKSTIQGMIEDGVNGTPSGDGLKQLLAKAGGNNAAAFYKAARMYNSGSVDPSGDLGKGIATHCYVSDIANRLLGWSEGVGGCHM